MEALTAIEQLQTLIAKTFNGGILEPLGSRLDALKEIDPDRLVEVLSDSYVQLCNITQAEPVTWGCVNAAVERKRELDDMAAKYGL